MGFSIAPCFEGPSAVGNMYVYGTAHGSKYEQRQYNANIAHEVASHTESDYRGKQHHIYFDAASCAAHASTKLHMDTNIYVSNSKCHQVLSVVNETILDIAHV